MIEMTSKLCFTHLSRQLSDALANDGYPIDHKLIVELCMFQIAALGASKLTESDGTDMYTPPVVLSAIFSEWMAALGNELGLEAAENDDTPQWITSNMAHTHELLLSLRELGIGSMSTFDKDMQAKIGFSLAELLAKACETSESLEQTTTRLQRKYKGLKAIKGKKDRY